MKLFANFFCYAWLLITLLVAGCQSDSQQAAETSATTKSANTVKYSKFFSIEPQKDYTILTVTPFEGNELRYALYPKTLPQPTIPDNCQPIAIPIESAALYGTTYAHLFELIDCQNIIKGFAGTSYLYSQSLRQAVAAGSITELGSGNQPNVELLNQLKPDIVMMYAGANDMDKLSLLQRTNIKVIINADFLENTPLGRAEWIKVVGLLCNKSNEADSIFNQVEQNYRQLKRKVNQIAQKPTVFANVPYGNTWYMPGGNSFMAHLLKDAGADYLWQEEAQTGSLPLSLETAFSRIQTADYWINPGSMESLDMIRKTDTRFGLLKAVQTGKVFNNNKRQLSGGGNDYWESGSARPDLVLADLIAIFHPEITPDHSFIYFQQLQ